MDHGYSQIRAISVLDVFKKFDIEIQKKGSIYRAKCLWHTDVEPSMQIGGKYNNCHCYACGKSWGVIDLVMQHEGVGFVDAVKWLENNFGCSLTKDGEKQDGWKVRRMEALCARSSPKYGGGEEGHADENVGMVGFDKEWVKVRMTMDNSFVMCLKDVFGMDAAGRVVRDYWLCSVGARFGVNDVGFPLIDRWGVIRDVKVQGYQWDKRSDRYFHGNGTCYWLAPTLPPRGEEKSHADEKQVIDRRCLFGEHLLNLHLDRTVVLVESPKNACVGSARFPELVWVAAGNKCALNREVLQVLKGRRVVVFPDNDAYKEWSDRLKGLSDIAMFKVLKTPADLGEKGDIADWILSKLIDN